MLILCVKVVFPGLCKKNFVNFHYILENQKQLFSRTTFQWLFPKTIMLVILQKHKQIFPLHALLVPKTKISGRTTEGNQFLDWQINLAYAYSSTDSRLNMPISVKLIKKTCNYSSILIYLILQQKKNKKQNKKTRSHIFWRKHLSLQRNQVFWRVLRQGDIIECISFFVDKQDLVDVKNACPQFVILEII